MKPFLFFVGWASVIGSALDAAIAAYAVGLVASGLTEIDVTVDRLLVGFLGFLYWIKGFALYVLPAPVVAWLFALPALVYFPVRVVLGAVFGAWVLAMARRR